MIRLRFLFRVRRVLDEHLQDGDLLMMCADHGFQSFRHQVNVNNLLAEAGLLKLKSGILPIAMSSKDARALLADRKKAWAPIVEEFANK